MWERNLIHYTYLVYFKVVVIQKVINFAVQCQVLYASLNADYVILLVNCWLTVGPIQMGPTYAADLRFLPLNEDKEP